jgi:Methyltransferase domain
LPDNYALGMLPTMRSPNPRRWLKHRARDLVARGVRPHGYELARANPVDHHVEGFDLVPRGRQEPFSTTDYDVLPKGQFDVVRRNYYSPIPDLSRLPEDIWCRRSNLGGVGLDPDMGIDFLESELAPFIAELQIEAENPGQPGVFFLHNSGFESVDAELLYSMIRSARPGRIIELGSGYTTLLINMAVKRNREEGAHTQHVVYDPYPREHVLGVDVPTPTRLEAISATDVPLTVFDQMEAGDVLFVDTTHTVKLGGDVNFIILDVLPRLQAGVLVHFHDIFLPWEYPRVWLEKMGYFWAEQYLLQAFLSFNDIFEVLVPAHAISRTHPERLARVIPSFKRGVAPGSFWLRRCGAGNSESSMSRVRSNL